MTAADLANHYTDGLAFFHDRFVPHLKGVLHKLSGGAWDLGDFVAYAAGSDVDFMTHLVEAVAAGGRVCLYPGDWFGFRVGATQTANIAWDASGRGELACLCVPSVRNGHMTEEMFGFLGGAPQCLLNLNLYPTLTFEERREVAEDLKPAARTGRAVDQLQPRLRPDCVALGVFLVHRDHPYRSRFDSQWRWFTYFFNALAARAFMLLDAAAIESIDKRPDLGARADPAGRTAARRDGELLREVVPPDRRSPCQADFADARGRPADVLQAGCCCDPRERDVKSRRAGTYPWA